MKGRKPLPTPLKVLRNNPGKRPLNRSEPKPDPIESIRPPEWLNAAAKKAWSDVADHLAKTGVLTVIDTHALERYAAVHARWTDAEKHISENGATYECVNKNGTVYIALRPEARMALTWAKLASQLAEQLGLTPSARSRLHINPPKDDSFSGYMKQKTGARRFLA